MEDIILILFLIICVSTDFLFRKIYNIITIPTVFIGLIYYTTTSGVEGFLLSGEGIILGLALLFIPFLSGGMGAGDVKMLAAVGALKGPVFVFHTFLYGSIIGGFVALLIIIKRKNIKNTLARITYSFAGRMNLLDRSDSALSIPYGVAIGLGAVLSYLLEGLI